MGDRFNPDVKIAAKDDNQYALQAGVDLGRPAFVFGKTESNLPATELEYVVIAQTEAICREVLEAKIRGGSASAAKVKQDFRSATAQPPFPNPEDTTVIKTCCSVSHNVSVLFAGMVKSLPKLVEVPGTRAVLASGRRDGRGASRRLKEIIIAKGREGQELLREFEPDPPVERAKAATTK